MILLSLIGLMTALLINEAALPIDKYNYMVGNGKGVMNFFDRYNFRHYGKSPYTNPVFNPNRKPRLLCTADTEACFSYDRSSPIGPYCWGTINGDSTRCCDASGSFQSPISIPRPTRTEYTPKKLHYLSWSTTGKVENIGVYPEFSSTDVEPLILMGVPGSEEGYVFDNLHIHSGVRGAYRQTENLLHGRSFSAEAHIVHHRKDFKNVAEASRHRGGIAVVSIFLTHEIGRYRPTQSRAFETILNQLFKITEFTEEAHVCRAENQRIRRPDIYGRLGIERVCRNNRPDFNYGYREAEREFRCLLHQQARGCGKPVDHVTFNPNDLLPPRSTYLTFEGGLTTPPCSESVIWIVAETPAYISPEHIENIHKLKSRIVNQTVSDFGNLRPLQDHAERDVYRMVYGRYPPRRGEGDDDRRDDDDDDDYYFDDFYDDNYHNDDDYYDDRGDDDDRDGGDDRRRNGDGRDGNDYGDGRDGNGNDDGRHRNRYGDGGYRNDDGDDRRRGRDRIGRRYGDDRWERRNDDRGENEREDGRRWRRRFNDRRRGRGRWGDDEGDDN